MAEGHAVARWADSLRALVGERVVKVQAPRRWQDRATSLVGATVTDIRTHGKHLVIVFSVPFVVHAHAMQYGSWQVGARGLRPRKEARYIRLRLVTPSHEALYFSGPVMEILTVNEFAIHDRFRRLGPDLLHEGFDIAAAAARIQRETRDIASVLLDQRVVAGIGNIYKSEGLFLGCVHPLTPASAVSVAALTSILGSLIPLMQAGRRHDGATITLPEELRTGQLLRNWVYRRRGKPCLICGTPIKMLREGELQRMTFFCPSCQCSAPRPGH